MKLNDTDWQICAQTHDRLGESILWHPAEAALYWIDFYGPVVHRQKRVKGPVESWTIAAGAAMGSLVFADDGHLLLAMDHSIHFFHPDTGTTRFFADPKRGRMDLAYNDGKIDRAGRYWLGTYDIAETEPLATFYRVAANGTTYLADQGFVVCNGPAFSPDNRRLFFSDSIGRKILAYDLTEDGSLSGRRTFFAFQPDDGMPDGLTVDSAGNVWCALYGGSKIVCLDAKGTLEQSIALPVPHVTSLCFGGPDLRTLFVTTGWSAGTTETTKEQDLGGAVFMRPVDCPGLPEPVLRLPA